MDTPEFEPSESFVFDPEGIVIELPAGFHPDNFGLPINEDDDNDPAILFMDALVAYVTSLGGKVGGSMRLADYHAYNFDPEYYYVTSREIYLDEEE